MQNHIWYPNSNHICKFLLLDIIQNLIKLNIDHNIIPLTGTRAKGSHEEMIERDWGTWI